MIECDDDAGAGVTRIRLGRTDLRGSLPAEHIRRVMLRGLVDLRTCFDQLLDTDICPRSGHVSVKLIIAPSGGVQSAALSSSTLGDAATEQCIVAAVGAWSFAEPEGGGIVVVNQAFRFALTDG